MIQFLIEKYIGNSISDKRNIGGQKENNICDPATLRYLWNWEKNNKLNLMILKYPQSQRENNRFDLITLRYSWSRIENNLCLSNIYKVRENNNLNPMTLNTRRIKKRIINKTTIIFQLRKPTKSNKEITSISWEQI